jgi:hypothetical protein
MAQKQMLWAEVILWNGGATSGVGGASEGEEKHRTTKGKRGGRKKKKKELNSWVSRNAVVESRVP